MTGAARAMSQANVEIVRAMYEVANASGKLDANFEILVPEVEFHVLSRFRARGRDGMEVRLQLANLWTVQDGQIVRMDALSDRAGALEAVGLSE